MVVETVLVEIKSVKKMRVSVEVYRIVVVIDVMFEKVNEKMIVLT